MTEIVQYTPPLSLLETALSDIASPLCVFPFRESGRGGVKLKINDYSVLPTIFNRNLEFKTVNNEL